MIDGHFDGNDKEFTEGVQPRMTIDILPDVALLEVFHFYLEETPEEWPMLVHVCRDWRNVAFGSPRRLGLRIYFRADTSVRKTLARGVWPLLPISIKTSRYNWGVGSISEALERNVDNIFEALAQNWLAEWRVDNTLAALEHNDRICQLELPHFPNSQFEKFFAVMQRPFPALTDLRLGPDDTKAPLVPVPTSFLGGSSPHLRTLDLNYIPYPGLPKLLSSATHLVDLSLRGISRSGYISPESMLNCLSALTRLESLHIGLRSVPRQRRRFLPPPTRTLLPVLSHLLFEGVTGYLEDLLAWIDAPELDSLNVTFFNQKFDTPQLTQLISCTPKFKACNHAQLFFSYLKAWVILSQAYNGGVELRIAYSCQPDEHASTLEQICRSSFPQALIPTTEHLYVLVCGDYEEDFEVENDEWLELLCPFTGAKALYLSSKFMLSLPLALQELSREEETEVLPSLETIFLEDDPSFPQPPDVRDVIGRMVSIRHPITVSAWDIDSASEMEDTW